MKLRGLVVTLALAVGMSFGFVWQHRLSGQFSAADPKIIVTLVIFALYVAYSLLSVKAGWRGARAAICQRHASAIRPNLPRSNGS